MSQTERQTLIDHPCTIPADIEVYRSMLQSLVMQYNSEPAPTLPIDPSPAWLNEQAIPTEIQIKAQELGLTIDTSRWSNLTPLQRYALIKLSRPSHENRNFLPALQEFDLVAP